MQPSPTAHRYKVAEWPTECRGMLLTRKQRAVIRLAREGFGPTKIASVTGLHRVTVSNLLSRAKRNLRRNGLDPAMVIGGHEADFLDLVA